MFHKYFHLAIKLAMCNNLSTKFIELSNPHFHQPNQKSFKLLYFAFTRNLETFHKTHKRILTQFEEPVKVRLKKQEQVFVDSHIKKIYEENGHKLIKQNLQRNSNVEFIMNTYHLQYYQRKSQDSKTIQQDQSSIESMQKSDQRPVLTQQKSRSKTIANHYTSPESINKNLNYRDPKNRKNITDINVSAFAQPSEKKILFYKRNYTNLKNRQRNYSLHSETIDNRNERLENLSSCAFEQQKTSRDHTQTSLKQHPQRDHFNETFRPFCGLNTKDIFVKKPINKINNSQQNSTLNDFKINFVSRAIMRGRFTTKKTCNNQFTGTFYEANTIQHLRDDQQSKLMMKQNILKISSDLAIKTLQPQGYRGKSRLRYRSQNQSK